MRVLINIKVGTTNNQPAMDVVEKSVPLLISPEALIDLKQSELTLFGKRTKRVKMTRHWIITFKIYQPGRNPKPTLRGYCSHMKTRARQNGTRIWRNATFDSAIQNLKRSLRL